jgi:elongation factor Ts
MSEIELIKSIRNRTSLPLGAIKKAIAELQTEEEEKIIAYLREQGVLKAQARQDRETKQGAIFSYIHEGRVGVLVEVKCESDFVSRGERFKELGNDLALHIAAYNPKFVSPETVDQDFIEKELNIQRELMKNEGKPENIIDKILEGKKASIEKDFSLLSQPFIKDNTKTVGQIVLEVSQETGEKIEVTRFVMFSLNS